MKVDITCPDCGKLRKIDSWNFYLRRWNVMRSTKISISMFCVLILLASCAGLTKSQRVLWSLDVYEAQYQSYLTAVINPDLPDNVKQMLREDPKKITDQFINPNLSEDRKKVLRVKKDILVELKPLVLMAAEYHKTGQLPSEDIQNKLTELINRLVELSED